MVHRLAASTLALVLLIGIALSARPAHAAEAGPPIGQWLGRFPDGGQLALVVQRDGTCMYHVAGFTPITGVASWRPTSPVGGILTITYHNAGFENHSYYSITWVNARTVVLSDPYFRVTLQRQY
jgi:hypothetical protein